MIASSRAQSGSLRLALPNRRSWYQQSSLQHEHIHDSFSDNDERNSSPDSVGRKPHYREYHVSPHHYQKRTNYQKHNHRQLPVRTVCSELHIKPVFICRNGELDIELDIDGGIKPYKIEWENGSHDAKLRNVDYDSQVLVRVRDVTKCETTKYIRTPPNSDSQQCE